MPKHTYTKETQMWAEHTSKRCVLTTEPLRYNCSESEVGRIQLDLLTTLAVLRDEAPELYAWLTFVNRYSIVRKPEDL